MLLLLLLAAVVLEFCFCSAVLEADRGPGPKVTVLVAGFSKTVAGFSKTEPLTTSFFWEEAPVQVHQMRFESAVVEVSLVVLESAVVVDSAVVVESAVVVVESAVVGGEDLVLLEHEKRICAESSCRPRNQRSTSIAEAVVVIAVSATN